MAGAVRGLGPRARQPVDDVAPAGRGQGTADVLHRERRAQVGERQPLPERPPAQRAKHERRAEHVPGARRVVRVHRQRGCPFLLAGRGVDREGTLPAAGDHRHWHAVRQRVQRVVRVLGVGVGHRLHAVGQECVEVLELREHARRPFLVVIPAGVREQQHPRSGGVLDPLARLRVDVRESGPGLRDGGGQLTGGNRRRMHVGQHRAVSLDHHGHRHRRVPVCEAARAGEVDALLLGERGPAEIPVHVVAERGGERRAHAQPARGDREVGDAAGT